MEALPRLGRLGIPLLIGGERRRLFRYEDIETLALLHRRFIMDRGYDAVVGIARGGLYLACMVAQSTDLPLRVAYYDRRSRHVHLPSSFATRRVLLVEDVAGKGNTLLDVAAKLHTRGIAADIMVVCSDDLSRIVPDIGVRLSPGERHWFPWERAQAGPTDAQRQASAMDLDCPYWRTAFDLDGVFVADLPKRDYFRSLEVTLQRRDQLAPLARPPQWRDGDWIVSGRLTTDEARTRRWLHRHGITPGKLLLRPDQQEPPSTFKARMLCTHRIVEFFESDLAQAVTIAKDPAVVVWHYRSARRMPRRIQDAPPSPRQPCHHLSNPSIRS
ncbi:orotate phosphoribosyltransferase [Bordetella ansorpii]|uniref:Orotate phosphoribosyltransferase n=1 Tax=Bordetella ansorpii TaxID=288768 RepID=A0A157SS85_9BORD|nr:phosphoribosyltransferase [Bordetella ansorpii]SAI73161.1 orotate phosphoribosyltransferase [Bordetella ansorpii]